MFPSSTSCAGNGGPWSSRCRGSTPASSAARPCPWPEDDQSIERKNTITATREYLHDDGGVLIDEHEDVRQEEGGDALLHLRLLQVFAEMGNAGKSVSTKGHLIPGIECLCRTCRGESEG